MKNATTPAGFLPYRDDPRVRLRALQYVNLATIAERFGIDVAYQYRAAAGVARSRGFKEQLLVTMTCVPGQGEVYVVWSEKTGPGTITTVSLGRVPAASANNQMSFL